MKTYLWYSKEAHYGIPTGRPLLDGFNGNALGRISVYLDSSGEPVKVTHVSPQPQSWEIKDMQLVDIVEQPNCLMASGNLQQAGREYCWGHNIQPDVQNLLRHVDALDMKSGHARFRIPVSKPLQLKGRTP